MKKAWSGRFKEDTEKTVERFTCSLTFDARLWKYDIAGSIAHVKMLGKQGIISKKDADLIVKGLNRIKHDIEKGTFRFHEKLEDIHMNIEHALIRKIGAVGGKMHTARSRNDQINLDMRLYMRDEINNIQKLLRSLKKIFVSLAEKHIDTVIPGYTHLQRAQPVLLSHYLLAYYEMLKRDSQRLEECYQRVNVLPLGSAALAGTTLPIDRQYVARLLKFPAVTENSIDTVSDRDFIAEFISASAMLMMHLSRLSEELVLWCSEEFGFLALPDAYTTGSSMMPQKKNPDVLELIRGKTGRVYGNLMALLTVMKALPLAYNRDMQEDKEPLFDTMDTVKSCLEVLCKMLPKVTFQKALLCDAAGRGFLMATDIAEYLVDRGMPFRDAHRVTGRIVKYCIDEQKELADMSVNEFRKFSKLFDREIQSHLSIKASVNNKKSYGGTSKKLVRNRLKAIRRGQ